MMGCCSTASSATLCCRPVTPSVHHLSLSVCVCLTGVTGDGTGGTSIWEREFEDEIRPGLKHDKPGSASLSLSLSLPLCLSQYL
jgi:hypothetical protein